ISQLGGEPDFSPEGLTTRSHSEYVPGTTLLDMVKEDLVAERIAIESYSEMIRFFGDKDHTSRRLMEEILAKEETPVWFPGIRASLGDFWGMPSAWSVGLHSKSGSSLSLLPLQVKIFSYL